MPLSEYENPASVRRFRLLINGFASGISFDQFEVAVSKVRAAAKDERSYELFDIQSRTFVWSRPAKMQRVNLYSRGRAASRTPA